MDNIFVERPWRAIKYREVHLKAYADGREARAGFGSSMEFHNERRRRQAMANQMPMTQWRNGIENAQAADAVDMTRRLDNARASTLRNALALSRHAAAGTEAAKATEEGSLIFNRARAGQFTLQPGDPVVPRMGSAQIALGTEVL